MPDKPFYTPENVDDILGQFAALEQPKRQLSARQLIMDEMMPEIERKLQSGWRYDDLVEGLRQVGISLRANTLRNYVARARGKGSKKTSKKAAPSRQKEPAATVPQPPANAGDNPPAVHPRRRPKRKFAGFDESP